MQPMGKRSTTIFFAALSLVAAMLPAASEPMRPLHEITQTMERCYAALAPMGDSIFRILNSAAESSSIARFSWLNGSAAYFLKAPIEARLVDGFFRFLCFGLRLAIRA